MLFLDFCPVSQHGRDRAQNGRLSYGIGDAGRGESASNNLGRMVRRDVDLLSLPQDRWGAPQHWLQA